MRFGRRHPRPGAHSPAAEPGCGPDDRFEDVIVLHPLTQRADCCVGAASYRVVLPAVPGEQRRRELFLCGHHFRATAAAQERSGACVYDARGRLVAGPVPVTVPDAPDLRLLSHAGPTAP